MQAKAGWLIVAFGCLTVACAQDDGAFVNYNGDSCVQNGTGCPRNCYQGTFNEHAYLFCRDLRGWQDAERVCRSAGLVLTRIESEEENDWLRSTADRRELSRKNLWLGGDDREFGETWVWQDGNEFWQGRGGGEAIAGLYSNWRGGQPDSNKHEDCLEMNGDGRWNDNECDDKQAFVCEDYAQR